MKPVSGEEQAARALQRENFREGQTQSESLAKISSVNECEEVTQSESTNQQVEGSNFRLHNQA